MIPMLIERNVNLFFEWGAASSVAMVFLFAVLALFALINRLFSVERLFGDWTAFPAVAGRIAIADTSARDERLVRVVAIIAIVAVDDAAMQGEFTRAAA